jgi:hypothetical protein
VTIDAVSALSNHPLPTLAVGVIVTALPLAAGVTYVKLAMLAVAVYVGSSVAAASTCAMLAGGHCPNC